MMIEAWPFTGRLTNTAGVEPRTAQLLVQASGREDDEPVHLVGERPRGPDLLVGVLAGVDQQQLELGFAGRPTGGLHQRREMGVGEVGHDHRHVAGLAGDQAAGGPVGDEVELGDDGLDPLPRGGGDLLGVVERPGDGGGVHAGAGGDVFDRHPVGAPHGAGR